MFTTVSSIISIPSYITIVKLDYQAKFNIQHIKLITFGTGLTMDNVLDWTKIIKHDGVDNLSSVDDNVSTFYTELATFNNQFDNEIIVIISATNNKAYNGQSSGHHHHQSDCGRPTYDMLHI